jgi:hypothetical protein
VNWIDPTGHSVEEGCHGENVTSCGSQGSSDPSSTPTVTKLDDGRQVKVYSDGRIIIVGTDGKETKVDPPTSSDSGGSHGNWVLVHPGTFILTGLGIAMALSVGPPSTVGSSNSVARNTTQILIWRGAGVVIAAAGATSSKIDGFITQVGQEAWQAVKDGWKWSTGGYEF